MLVNSSEPSVAALGSLRDALAWPLGAPWPEDRPLADWQRDGATALRAPPVRTAYGTLLNHRAALVALGEAVHEPPYKAPPKAPVLYIKPRNTFAGHGDAVVVPAGVDELEIGTTLGIVIGREACRVGEAEALSCVAGYTVCNDVSVPHASFYRPSLRFKCRDGFLPIGPWVVAARHVADPDALAVRVDIDGQRVQQTSTAGMQRPVARLIADLSAFMTLAAGDLLMLGVAAGAPRARAGQRVRIHIDGIGSLENPLVAEGLG
jgi:5-oxopent-3-ene-1,2,5-tricarboxylate decarboxylase / 2-hydroxyhepta-2,4-diene-1,7-dioate isomerase